MEMSQAIMLLYLYALAGRPERTQELVREIFDTQYKTNPTDFAEMMIADRCLLGICLVRWDSIR